MNLWKNKIINQYYL